jgi:hypothetical protein
LKSKLSDLTATSTGESRQAAARALMYRDLTIYGLGAAAAGVSVLALTEPAEAQIVYTPAHETINSGQKLLIDLNHDGIADLALREMKCSLSSGFPGNSLKAGPLAGAGIERRKLEPLEAAALSAGSEISGSQVFNNAGAGMVIFTNYGDYYAGYWGAAGTAYLGIRFSIDEETHYGWVRVKVTYNPSRKDIAALVSGYAYQTQANTPITAGDTGSSRSDAAGEKLISSESATKPGRSLGELAAGSFVFRPSH